MLVFLLCILYFISGSLFKVRNLEFWINWRNYLEISFLVQSALLGWFWGLPAVKEGDMGGGGGSEHRNTAKKLTNTASPQEKSTKHRHRNTHF